MILFLFPGLFLFCSDLFHYVKRKKYLDGQQVLDTHRARGCPFITNVDGKDFVVDGITKYDGYGDECRGIKFAGVAVFHKPKLVGCAGSPGGWQDLPSHRWRKSLGV